MQHNELKGISFNLTFKHNPLLYNSTKIMSKWAAITPKSVKQTKSKSTISTQGSMANLHLPSSSSTSTKSIDEEVARAVQQLLSIQKENSGMRDNLTHLSEGVIEASASSPSPTKETSCNMDIDTMNYKTPENESFVPANEVYAGKKHNKRSIKRSRQSQITDQSDHQPFFSDSDRDQIENSVQLSPKRPRSEYETSNNGKRNLKQELAVPTQNNAKYQKVGQEAGFIISAYYTRGHEEKLQEFKPVYINVGNPNQAKELIGVRKNTKFISLGKKTNNEQQPSYLVLSFENRKKSNSPFIEYPLTRLDMIIKALVELKEFTMARGYYKETPILNCKYPESTRLTAHDDKDTVLEALTHS